MLFERAMEFYRRRLWLRIRAEEAVGILLPGKPDSELMIASIMGSESDEYGLAFYRGKDAASLMLKVTDGEDVVEEVDELVFSIWALNEIPMEFRETLDRARFKGRRETLAPWFMVKKPGKWPRDLKKSEQQTLLFALNAVLEADDKGQLRPFSVRDGRILSFELEGSMLEPILKPAVRKLPKVEAFCLSDFEAQLDCLAADLPRRDGDWVVGLLPTPLSAGKDGTSCYGAVIIDRSGAQAINVDFIPGNAPVKFANLVIATMNGENLGNWRGLPQSVVFTNQKTFALLESLLTKRGVKSRFSPSDPKLEKMSKSILEEIDLTAEVESQDSEPELSECELWRDRDRDVSDALYDQMKRSRRDLKKAEKKYFGSKGQVTDGEEHSLAETAFLEWVFFSYRPDAKSKTIAELTLNRANFESEFTMDILQARIDADLSFYRVDEVEVGETITLIDTIDGKHHVVHDRNLSLTVDIDMLFAARVYSVGPYTFLWLASPPVDVVQHHKIVDRLVPSNIILEDVLRETPERLGRVIDWLIEDHADEASHPPAMLNSHGEPYCPTLLSYEVRDAKTAIEALTERPDIEFDPERQTALFLGDAENGGPIAHALGTSLQFIGDELLVKITSIERGLAVREWLDDLPGLSFLNSKTIDINIDLDERPLDDSLPFVGENLQGPEVTELLQKIMDEHYRSWIDCPLPGLAGKTPRQAASTQHGQRKVRQLILSISSLPAPGGQKISPPREWMLEELGI